MFVKPQREQRFIALIRETYSQPPHALIEIARNKDRYSVILRSAALRNLVSSSPTELTLGRCYAERRRIVRAHYGI
ncbi:hypothetical protein LJR129_005083 [Acidovorax sp. LjRoot129]